MEQSNTPEINVTQMIVKKYGMQKARTCMMMYRANIPERYWDVDSKHFMTCDDDVHEQIIKTISDTYHWVTLAGDDVRTTKIIVRTLKTLMFEHRMKVYFLDFFDLMSRPMIKYDQSALNRILHELDLIDVIGIVNVSYGDFYDNVDEIFKTFVNSLMNTQFNKQLIIGLEGFEDGELTDHYPVFGEYVSKHEIFTQIILEQ